MRRPHRFCVTSERIVPQAAHCPGHTLAPSGPDSAGVCTGFEKYYYAVCALLKKLAKGCIIIS